MYVAPLMTDDHVRNVYLPGGKWIDYQTGKIYASGWNKIEAGPIPAIILIRDGAAIPQVDVAQSTDRIDWTTLKWKSYLVDKKIAKGLLFLPTDTDVHELTFKK